MAGIGEPLGIVVSYGANWRVSSDLRPVAQLSQDAGHTTVDYPANNSIGVSSFIAAHVGIVTPGYDNFRSHALPPAQTSLTTVI